MKPSALPTCLAVILAALLPSLAGAAEKESPEELLRRIDKRMSFASDYKGAVRMKETRKDGSERVSEMLVYRRDASSNLLFLITKPRNMAGGGYLRIGKNMWEYTPATGQWDRTTQRANIVGTIACEGDFDRSKLAEDYTAKDEGVETIEGTAYRKLLLTAKPDAQVSFPLYRLWVDPDDNIVKRVGYAPSGKVLRTDIIRAYQRLKDPVSGELVYHYKEVLEMEEEEGTRVVVKYEEVELAPLDPNIFTKSWLEGRLR
ncbi:outer membrane lipoprotein-sorting protein [Vitiosangium sp. GDMCC 1.1324]|uniref:outer membrane lipoprotein-sorting protein n=1 Tax=Vitiosangium sp. (strain GDMCC 1.1324) TaxID=2138576 RepID=UPI000D3500EF|nr:outer membrane lipoprotein-sorting protein [Vitiosangium sp. GDMCC 1.1324]PTL79267.1 outer membrane lipoprotein-sorting protein [Vitiosangium sp. GDMCC 1.1324]